MSERHISRSLSRDSSHRSKHPRSPSPPSLVYHPNILPRSVPTPALVESVAGGAHYSGVRLDSDVVLKHRRSSHSEPHHHTQLKCDHERIMKDLNELYCCRPTLDIFDRSWNKNAVYEDPLCKCKGYKEYASQFFAMPKFFSKSETISSRVMSSTNIPNRLVYHQVQEYTTRLLGRKKTVESIIVVDMDDDEKITHLVDQWEGKEMPSWFGSGFLRVLHAKVAPWIIHIPKQNA